MSQNLVNLVLTDEQIAAATAALDQLETALSGLVSLNPDERRALTRMGPKSEAFVRQTLSVLQQNPQVVPPAVDVGGAQVDMAALEGSIAPRVAPTKSRDSSQRRVSCASRSSAKCRSQRS